MAERALSPAVLRIFRVLLAALLVANLVRLAMVVPRWAAGEPPVYPGQYVGRLSFAVSHVSMLTAVLLTVGQARLSRRRLAIIIPLLLVSVLTLVANPRD